MHQLATIATAFGTRRVAEPEPLVTVQLHPSEVLSLLNLLAGAEEERETVGDQDGARRIAWRRVALREAVR